MRLLYAIARWLVRALPSALVDDGMEELPQVVVDLVQDSAERWGMRAAAGTALVEISSLVAVVARSWIGLVIDSGRDGLRRLRRGVAPELLLLFAFTRRSPARAIVAVGAIGLAAGAAGGYAGMEDNLRSDPDGVPGADRLTWVWGDRPWAPNGSRLVSDLHLGHLRDSADVFDGLAALWMVSGRVTTDLGSVHADVARASANFFGIVGAQPHLGRLFEEGEDEVGADWVAVLTHDFWQDEFGGDPSVLGRRIVVGVPEMTVIGVLPPDFEAPVPEALGPYGEPSVWLPARHRFVGPGLPQDVQAILARRGSGVTRAAAESRLAALSAAVDREVYASRGFRYDAEPLSVAEAPGVVGAVGALAWALAALLMSGVGLTVVLSLSAAEHRRGTLALVGALGGVRGRLLTLHATEAVGLAALGGLVGLSSVGLGFVWLDMDGWPRASAPAAPWSSVVSAVAVWSLALGLIHGGVGWAVATVRATRPTDAPARGPRTLAAAQTGLALAVLLGALTADARVEETIARGGGVATADRVAFNVYPMPDAYPNGASRDRFFDALERRLEAHPDVRDVTAVSALPLSGGSTQVPISRTPPASDVDPGAFSVAEWTGFDGALTESPASGRWIDLNVARPGFFSDNVVPVRAGRGFEAADSAAADRVVLVSADLSEALWPTGGAIGDSVWLVGSWRRVVGVVDPLALHGVAPRGEQAWVPHAQVLGGRMSVIVTSRLDVEAVRDLGRNAVRAIDPGVPIGGVQSLRAVVDEATTDERLLAALSTWLSLLAGAMAACALFVALSGLVARSRREIAVRLVLGGRALAMAGWVVAQGLRQVAIGAALGLVVFASATWMFDPLAIVGGGFPAAPQIVACLVMAVLVSVCVAWVPALAAARTEPGRILDAG